MLDENQGKVKGGYAAAGVDIDAAQRALELIKGHVRSTFGPQVLSDVGFFGGLFQLAGYQDPVLISSVDGVGTKLKIAIILDKYDTIGIDLVNHCVNDILTGGAQPLFFLDYLAFGKLVPEHMAAIVGGMAQACREVGLALIGGETAEMPDLYAPGDFDIAGFIVGVVERDNIINGHTIQKGDVLLALPSSGLHTNGYSLARKVFDITSREPLDVYYPELGRTLGEELLEPHRCYFKELKPLLPMIKGLAHITGGGVIDNLPRILPQGLAARIKKGSWEVPAIFSLTQKCGSITEAEMYRVFNMGLGMIVICAPEDVARLSAALSQASVVGEVVAGRGGDRVVLE